MGLSSLFRPKFTAEQKDQLARFVERLNDIYSQHYLGFTVMASQLAELHQACKHALSSGMSRLAFIDAESLAQARTTIEARRASIDETLDVLRKMEIHDWYPDKLKNTHSERIRFIETERQSLDLPLQALSGAEPLAVSATENRLNMFYSGLNISASMSVGVKGKIKA